jgi:hypothetical protein
MEEVVGSIPISSTWINLAELVVYEYCRRSAERPERKERAVYTAHLRERSRSWP